MAGLCESRSKISEIRGEGLNRVFFNGHCILKLLLDGRLRLEIVNKIDAKTTKFLQRLIIKCCCGCFRGFGARKKGHFLTTKQ